MEARGKPITPSEGVINRYSRRNFLKVGGVAAGALVLSGCISYDRGVTDGIYDRDGTGLEIQRCLGEVSVRESDVARIRGSERIIVLQYGTRDVLGVINLPQEIRTRFLVSRTYRDGNRAFYAVTVYNPDVPQIARSYSAYCGRGIIIDLNYARR